VKVQKDNMLSSDRALNLGWDKSLISVFDSDLGKSGQTTTGREDFHRLMAAVGLGELALMGRYFQLETNRTTKQSIALLVL